ncbi:chemotaxis protein CheW [Thermoflexibacter ruber]|uniref:Purine-binding chemotaxis protein CheW n=1 Tax=Thermoflexibacter ruber TaxID=1003 RepID=A0A1I2H3L2_9BACT|nr:chemotaxis protein CheW [Thermoflexibacter ruber]SFF23919.1 purine-binding chemotaxis protein CheW [Thermoflexibacter ruber]
MSSISKKKEINHVKKHQLIVFKLEGQEYALFIDQIKEVVITPALTPVPLTPPYIKGVANIRGEILAMIDLVERFELKKQGQESTPKKLNFTLVIADEEKKMGLLVEELPQTLNVLETDMIQPSLIYQTEEEKNYIQFIVRLQSKENTQRLIIVIDLNKIILKEEVNSTLTNF